jgi:hypothetical protein
MAFQRFMQDGRENIFAVGEAVVQLAHAHTIGLELPVPELSSVLMQLLPPLVLAYVAVPKILLNMQDETVLFSRDKCFVLGGGRADKDARVQVVIPALVSDGKALTPVYVK